MEDYEQETNWLAWVLGGLSLVLLAGGIYLWNGNKALTRQNDLTERRADSLLSVRLQLETDLNKLNSELATAQVDNTELNKRIEDASRRLAQNDVSLRTLRRSSAGRALTLQQLDRNLTNLTTQRDSLNNQINAMQGKIGWLTDSSMAYQNRNEQLGQEVAQLNSTLLTMVPRASLTGDGFRVEAVKANHKETAKAKKVDALTISLNVPGEMNLTGQQDVYLSLTDEGRKAALPPLQTETVNLATTNEVIPVHAVQAVTFGPGQQRITFQLDPDADLKPGVYRAAVYTKNVYIGSVEFRFRDSFWFF